MLFCDLNVPEIDSWQLNQTRAQMALRLGWAAIACAHATADILAKDGDRCSIRAVATESLETAAREAAPALQFTHSLLRRPGGGKGHKRQKLAEATADDKPQSTNVAGSVAAQTMCGTGAADAEATHAQPMGSPAVATLDAADTPAAAHSGAGAASAATAAVEQLPMDADEAVTGREVPQAASQPAADHATVRGPSKQSPGQAPAVPFRQLTRLTFAATEAGQAQLLTHRLDITMTYDIIAVQPLSERVMQQACMSLPVDLISLDLAQRLPFRLRPQLLHAAVARGVHFEVSYAPALREATARRNLFANAQALARATRGHGIILSSGARSAFELRGPPDVVNLATLFGLNQHQAKVACSHACQAVIEHGARRRAYKGVLTIHRLQPGGDAALGVANSSVSGSVTDTQPSSNTAAAATESSRDAAKADSPATWQVMSPARPGSRAKASPQPLRKHPQQQQRQKKGKRKR